MISFLSTLLQSLVIQPGPIMATSVPDLATRKLMIELQLADIQALESSDKGKGRYDEPSNQDAAIALLKEELQRLEQSTIDHIMCQSMARAMLSDDSVIRAHTKEEEQAERDREYAMGRKPFATGDATSENNAKHSDTDDELILKLAALYMDDEEQLNDRAERMLADANNETPSQQEEVQGGESSSWAASRSQKKFAKERQCHACGDNVLFFDICRCPCSHEYCRACLSQLFQLASVDESLFPPRCCKQNIPLEKNLIFLPRDVVSLFRQKEIEFATTDRTYCHRPECSAFIPPILSQGDVMACPTCKNQTCTHCKGEAHEHECPEDPNRKLLDAVAVENGWQRCDSCQRMIELSHGCNHISKSPEKHQTVALLPT